ncbi:MAG: GNAT family N-acetyltransferase [Hyphomicrobiales bacterium]|nr:GNAT family N-acetyltransferase [Hyphomicrobiales bacterium]
MAFLRSVPLSDSGPLLRGDRLTLRVPQAHDYTEWANLREASEAFLRPWEPEWAADELSRSAFRRRLRYYHRDIREGTGYAFFLLKSDDSTLIGGITLTNARRGVSQSISIGYWIGATYSRQGYMTSALEMLMPFVFRQLGFHRLEAACLPSNLPSRKLLMKSGFDHEGFARKYLKINGLWQDHLLFSAIDDSLRS